jgi:ankyrin repeat protein
MLRVKKMIGMNAGRAYFFILVMLFVVLFVSCSKESSIGTGNILVEIIKKGDLLQIKKEINRKNVNIKDKNMDTPLLCAAKEAHNPEIINFLIKSKANLEERDNDGHTPLMIAISRNYSYPEIALTLIKAGADVNAVYNKPYYNEYKNTPLMYAAYMQNTPFVIQSLIEAGADVNAKNHDGSTPLLIASRYVNNPDIIDILLKAGAKIDEKNKDGFTPLMRAMQNSVHPDIAIELIKNKANVNSVLESDRRTPLFIGLSGNHAKPAVIQNLIDYGADANARDIKNKTPLMYAVEYCNEEIVKILLNAKADINAKDNNGKTAADYIEHSYYMKGKDLRNLK